VHSVKVEETDSKDDPEFGLNGPTLIELKERNLMVYCIDNKTI